MLIACCFRDKSRDFAGKDLADIYGAIQNIFEISNLAPPAGGLFAGRCGIQISLPSDVAPTYSAFVLSSMAL